MAGKKGMIAGKPGRNSVRLKAWQSMRILRRFTIPDLCRTAGARTNNMRKFVRALARHGYVGKFGGYVSGRSGDYQAWRLIRDTGPDYPLRCERCGDPLGYPCKTGGVYDGTDTAA